MNALSLAEFDKMAGVLSLYVAVSSFMIALFAVLATGLLFFFAARDNRRSHEIELKQNNFLNGIHLVGIIAGVRDTDKDGKAMEFMQIAALAAMKNYPDMLPVLKFMQAHYLHNGHNMKPAYLAAVADAIHSIEES